MCKVVDYTNSWRVVHGATGNTKGYAWKVQPPYQPQQPPLIPLSIDLCVLWYVYIRPTEQAQLEAGVILQFISNAVDAAIGVPPRGHKHSRGRQDPDEGIEK